MAGRSRTGAGSPADAGTLMQVVVAIRWNVRCTGGGPLLMQARATGHHDERVMGWWGDRHFDICQDGARVRAVQQDVGSGEGDK